MPKRQAIGIVRSDKADKTRRVEIPRLVRHPTYGKYVRRKTICYVHDEENSSGLGDTVEIEECQPMSKTKRWTLLRVVEKSRAVDVTAMRAARRAAEAEGADAAEVAVSDAPADSDSQGEAEAQGGNEEG